MDDWAWEQLEPWLQVRVELPVGPLFCVVNGPTRGRPWSAAAACSELRHLAREAGVRRRFAPHQLQHAHAVEMARRAHGVLAVHRTMVVWWTLDRPMVAVVRAVFDERVKPIARKRVQGRLHHGDAVLRPCCRVSHHGASVVQVVRLYTAAASERYSATSRRSVSPCDTAKQLVVPLGGMRAYRRELRRGRS
jgi:hypothetical protein